jgi:hypothetical protein
MRMLDYSRFSPRGIFALVNAKTSWLSPAGKVLRRVVPLLLLIYLAYAFTQLGWTQIWSARPRFWVFYALLPWAYFLPAIFEMLIYRNLWGTKNSPSLKILLRKQFLNSNLFEYSGEAYFFLWARKGLKLTNSWLMHAIKDSNILSAGAALAVVWIVVLVLGVTGGGTIAAFVSRHLLAFGVIAAIPLVLTLGLVIGGQRVTVLSRRQMAETFLIHFARCVIAFVLELVVWWLSMALPSLAACFSFVALRLFISRLPLLPRKDLLFVGIALASASLLKLSAPAIAAVFAIMFATDQIMGMLFAGVPWLLERKVEQLETGLVRR